MAQQYPPHQESIDHKSSVPIISQIETSKDSFADPQMARETMVQHKSTKAYDTTAPSPDALMATMEYVQPNLYVDNQERQNGILVASVSPAMLDQIQASLATEKLALVNITATLENSMTFPKSNPPLNSLCPLFHTMCTELSSYMLWPANCWFFVSLIQEHLFEQFHGYFAFGELKWGKLALDIRSHVSEKVRLDFQLPSPPTLPGLLQSLAILLQPTVPKHFATALELSKIWDICINSKKIPSRSLGHKLITALKQLIPALTPSELLAEEISTISYHATSVARVLLQHYKGPQSQTCLAHTLHAYAESLMVRKMKDDAHAAFYEAVVLWRGLPSHRLFSKPQLLKPSNHSAKAKFTLPTASLQYPLQLLRMHTSAHDLAASLVGLNASNLPKVMLDAANTEWWIYCAMGNGVGVARQPFAGDPFTQPPYHQDAKIPWYSPTRSHTEKLTAGYAAIHEAHAIWSSITANNSKLAKQLAACSYQVSLSLHEEQHPNRNDYYALSAIDEAVDVQLRVCKEGKSSLEDLETLLKYLQRQNMQEHYSLLHHPGFQSLWMHFGKRHSFI
ncbi:hypothetical protein DL93DRAFT_2173573 [Clavulina sp. PMI_390]|nr:hypothetical protein DL93DRAFT_2173573 [Clavulina sp. PMI_390]